MAHEKWTSITELFAALEAAHCRYIVLRNYEELDDETFYRSGHADIDFLAEKGFAETIKAYPRFAKEDGIRYLVDIAGTEVVIDVRTVGDDYYDSRWERDMLRNRRLHDGRFYVTDELNYYHSLAYHAILQKQVLSTEYSGRLDAMAAAIGIAASGEQEHLKVLEDFMRRNGYAYTVPMDIWVPLRAECVDQKLVKKRMQVRVRDAKIKAMQMGSRIKRRLLGR